MATGTFLFVLAGVGFATANLMKLIEYLDSPRLLDGTRREI